MIDFPYSLKRSNRRSLSIHIHPEDGVVVKAPVWAPEPLILRFLSDKADWVRKALQKTNSKPKVKKTFTPGERHLYFGEEFPLRITRSPQITKAKLSLLYDTFEALVPRGMTAFREHLDIKDAFTRWYLKQGKKIITQKVIHFSNILKVNYNRITLKRVSSIWGSCSSKNNLNFNRKLIMAPHAVVDYVVIHEVCHLIHHHHRPSFWKEVEKLDPNYKEHVKWLKTNHFLLTL